ncbi:patatin-like phospholipase domain-containing protein [Niveibacterium sp. 24ML]|uniref:patatin-like phospholipase family protein n=1 Tax=Niveibacterium sp. 24ML TaxID=2985512 RepID=UPI00226EECE2|nr:cyclic nucleotide-binding and patatin-like phospholipase domain-containing protein [Niveibacterium sp. 24ML]MCX9157152.1 patatin-like phospholipase domain-containing protein [Niveibacterium sp. 24ML]
MSHESGGELGVIEILKASRLFCQLDDTSMAQLVDNLRPLRVAAGELLFREGEPADSLIIVLSGRLRVSRRDRDGGLLLYNELCPGECIGEAGMILRQKRTNDVIALRDSTVAALTRSGYEALLNASPLVFSEVFSQAIYHYLRHIPQLSEHRRAQSFAIVPLQPGNEATLLARGLAKALSHERVRHLSPLATIADGEGDSEIARRLGPIDQLEINADYLIYEAEASLTAWTRFAVRQADQVIFVAPADSAPAAGALELRIREDAGFSFKRHHIVVVHGATASQPTAPGPWRADREVERVYLTRRGSEEDYASLARFLTGRAVGVVLGGGGARGFAHLGVLRALREARIPIDLVGGNSMGALIGAQFACGESLEAIQANTVAFATGGERPAVPLISILSGRRIERDLRKMFGDISIDTLWRPFFAAACNLSRACTTVQESGPLWRAVLASNSPAGLLPPVLHEGDLLVDGAILDNVPVEAMRTRLGTRLEKRRGNGTVIAIDVDVREALQVSAEMRRLSPWRKIKGHLSSDAAPTPGIGDILYRASHMGGLTQRGRTISMADHYLEPPVAEFALMAYRRANEIVEAGYRYACTEIEKWDRQTLPR